MMDDINAEMDLQFEGLVDNFYREPEIDERREVRSNLTGSTTASSFYDYETEKWENDWAVKSEE